jgi:hypothetical protein
MSMYAQRAAAYQAAQTIISSAKAAGRDLADQEQADVWAKIAKADISRAQFAELGKLGDDEPAPTGLHGQVFSPDAERGILTAVKSRTAYRMELSRKSLTGRRCPPAAS